jgi:hypothetical protein
VHNATLVIAKLVRLSRDAAFLLGLQKAGVRFLAADMAEANEMVVGIIAVVGKGTVHVLVAEAVAPYEHSIRRVSVPNERSVQRLKWLHQKLV